MTAVRILERPVTATLLGVRFWDPVTERVPQAGLAVTLRPDHGDRLGPARHAFPAAAGVFAFRGLQGLRGFEQADGEASAVSPLPRLPFVLQVADPERRFLPVAVRLMLPLPYRGLFPRDPAEPEGSFGGDRQFTLFSAPSRAIPNWQALVSGRLALADGSPAAHAGVEIDLGGGLAHQGFADAEGGFAVAFPFPPMPAGPATSPPSAQALADIEWPYLLRVYFDPALLEPVPGTGLPDHLGMLEQVLGPPSQVFAMPPSDGGVPMESLPGVLTRGRDAVARTAGLSTLVINPVASSP